MQVSSNQDTKKNFTGKTSINPKFKFEPNLGSDVELRIVNMFRSISEAALNEQPEGIDDLQAVLEEQAADLWENVTAIRECAKEILLLLGPTEIEVEDLGGIISSIPWVGETFNHKLQS